LKSFRGKVDLFKGERLQIFKSLHFSRGSTLFSSERGGQRLSYEWTITLENLFFEVVAVREEVRDTDLTKK
jgi:hypothetical protein